LKDFASGSVNNAAHVANSKGGLIVKATFSIIDPVRISLRLAWLIDPVEIVGLFGCRYRKNPMEPSFQNFSERDVDHGRTAAQDRLYLSKRD
jgi:hypothetical protein